MRSPAYCDCCNERLDRVDGYLLSTTTVVLSVSYWETLFTLAKTVHGVIGFDEQQQAHVFNGQLRRTAESETPWLICGACISIFATDHAAARDHARRGIDPPKSGAVDPGACALYAAIAWELVFGRWPATVEQPEAIDSCDFCGRKAYDGEVCGVVQPEALARLRAAGALDGGPLGPARPDRNGWLACVECTTRMSTKSRGR